VTDLAVRASRAERSGDHWMYETPRNVDSQPIIKGAAEEEAPKRFTTGCTLFASASEPKHHWDA
jgi:hypothetical protein